MSRDRKRSFADEPGWMIVCFIASVWSAASSAGSWWVRLGSVVLSLVWAALLLRCLVRRRRRSRAAADLPER
ncbi:hypothetical protein ACIQPR_17255 [Streptomyces sp. NPDC091280]|uniref:hypothetical protein n=1 Tax=Streptomyces sp. NPDC091280 TaxID=3365984 RepID=UPI0037FADCE8